MPRNPSPIRARRQNRPAIKSPARLAALGAPCVKLSTDSLSLALLAPLDGRSFLRSEIFKVFFFIATSPEYIQKMIYANEFWLAPQNFAPPRASQRHGLLDSRQARPTFPQQASALGLSSFFNFKLVKKRPGMHFCLEHAMLKLFSTRASAEPKEP